MNNWRLSLIIDDAQAIKIAAAYYSLPRDKRDDLDLLSEASGVSCDVGTILGRLKTTGVLGHKDPPVELIAIMNAYCSKKSRKIG